MLKDTHLQDTLTRTALDHGALLVGYTQVRKREPVIILGFPYSNAWVLNHPFYISKRFLDELARSYGVHRALRYLLNQEGYTANVKSALSVFGDIRPLAIAAGIGQWGKNGLVVNEQYGSRLLFTAVFTNAPLVVTDNTDCSTRTLTDATIPTAICTDCEECIRSCPGNAFEGGRFHIGRCAPKALRGCSECVQICKGKTLH